MNRDCGYDSDYGSGIHACGILMVKSMGKIRKQKRKTKHKTGNDQMRSYLNHLTQICVHQFHDLMYESASDQQGHGSQKSHQIHVDEFFERALRRERIQKSYDLMQSIVRHDWLERRHLHFCGSRFS